MQKHLRTNNQIRVPEVQVIDDTGSQLGNMKTFDALQLARSKGLDLVEVSPSQSVGRLPIAKIMDYGKYMYRKEKQEKSATKQKDQEIKTVRVGFKTGVHDLKFKSEQVDEFLKDGHPVRVELTLRGREKALAHMGREKLDTFLKLISEPHTTDGNPTRSPYGWLVLIRKDKKK
jgi:translation initiation factor IF-3